MSAFEEIRLKFTSTEPLKYGANAAAEFDDPGWPRFVRITDVDANGQLRDDTFRSLPPEVAEPFLLQVGDILLARSGATVGKSFIYDASWGDACYAGYLIRLRTSTSYFSKYIYWCLQSSKYWADIESNLIQSTIQNVSAERYASFRLPSPPLKTQQRIAQFLDKKTAQIDGLIEKKRALLDRLAEKRQALITRAVTKGLNPKAPMKPSGIDWLGDIPVHWEVSPLKRVVRYQEGPGILAVDFRDEGIPLLRVASIGGRYATLEGVNYLDSEMAKGKWGHFLTQTGDLLISASATSGIVSEVTAETAHCIPYTGIIRINPREGKAASSFIRHLLISDIFLSQIDQLKAGSTIQHFGPYHLGLMTIAVPPVEEQVAIGTELDRTLQKLDFSAEQITRSVEVLSEYRSALITAAVTGQIGGLQ